MNKLQKFASAHKSIFWDVSVDTLAHMDDIAILERFLCYGNWEEYKAIESIIGKERAKNIFQMRAYKDRSNIREETIRLFTYYFHLDAPHDRPLSRAM